MAGVREHTQHGTKKATVLQKLGHFFKSIGGKEGMDRTLYDGLLQAKKIHKIIIQHSYWQKNMVIMRYSLLI